MKRVALGALAILMASASYAASPEFSTADLCKILQPCKPPAEFASGPYRAKPVIRQVTLREVQKACSAGYGAFLGPKARPASIHAAVASGNFGAMGCTQLTSTECIVHVPGDLKAVLPELYQLVLAHELAHCRGWVHERY